MRQYAAQTHLLSRHLNIWPDVILQLSRGALHYVYAHMQSACMCMQPRMHRETPRRYLTQICTNVH